MPNVIPAALHRALLPLAHRLRHRWRQLARIPIAGVSVVLVNAEGAILLLRHSYGPAVWALPGGGLKRGEDPAECARREVQEELGITLDKVHAFATLEEELSGAPHTAHLFSATATAEPVPDGREILEARFFAPQALPDALGDTTRRRLAAWRERGGA